MVVSNNASDESMDIGVNIDNTGNDESDSDESMDECDSVGVWMKLLMLITQEVVREKDC